MAADISWDEIKKENVDLVSNLLLLKHTLYLVIVSTLLHKLLIKRTKL